MIKPVTSAPPSSTQPSDSSSMDVSSNGTFGAMLARQVQEKTAAAPKNSAAQAALANPAEAVIAPDVAMLPASITIASLSKKDIKLPAAKVSDNKKQTDLAPPLPDANSLAIVNPGIVAGNISQTPAQVTNTPGSAADTLSASGISTAIAGKIADSASSLTNPKLVPDSTSVTNPKLVPDSISVTNPAVEAKTVTGTTPSSAEALNMNLKLEANASNDKTASLPADFSRVLQNVVSTPESKPSSEAIQGAQLAAAQAMINTHMPASPVTHNIEAPLNSPAWAGEFSQKITWLSHEQSQVAELHLNPPDLGPMHVVISVTDNQAMAQFSSPHSEVRHAIENALPKLRESLADNGIMLGNATVSDQTPRDNGAGRFTQQRSRTSSVLAPEPQAVSLPAAAVRRHTGILDTFA